jgi:hypothetical protein
MSEITIGYLSWKRHNILEQTLKSVKLTIENIIVKEIET